MTYDPDHPLKHQKVPPWKRKRIDGPTELSPEDKEVDLDKVKPGKIVLDDLSGEEE